MSSNIVRPGRALSLDKLTQWSQRYRLEGAVFLSLLLVNLLFFLIFVNPAYRHKMSTEAALQSARSRVSHLLQYKKTQEDLNALEKTFLSQQALAKLADLLPAMARRRQLALPGVSYQTEKQKESDLRKIDLNFKVRGRYTDIRKFIHEVEGLEPFIYIKDMAIASSAKESSRLELEVKMVAALR
ncbi:MAG: type 4a pilus biogenesis protein PilO [Nitrospiria bacterium]